MTIRQLEFLPITAPGAGLAGVGGVDFENCPTGAFCLVAQHVEETPPSHICDALVETREVVSLHVVDIQVLDSNHAVGVYQAMRELVCKVFTFVFNSLMPQSNSFASSSPLTRSFLLLRQATLHTSKRLLFGFEKPGILDLLSARKREEGQESNVNPDGSAELRQGLLFNFTRERNKPFARRSLPYCARFNLPFSGSVNHGSNISDFREINGSSTQLEPVLGIRKGVIPVPSVKSGVSRSVSLLYTSKEAFISKIHSYSNILKYLRINRS